MKHSFFSLVLMVLFSLGALGQRAELATISSNDFPRFTLDSATGTQCVIFTLQQAQKIDNDLELLKIYQLLHMSSDSLIKSLVFKVKVQDTMISTLTMQVSELKNVNATQNSLVSNLKAQIEDYKKNLALADTQLGLKDEQIKNLNKEIKKQKRLKIAGFSVGGLGILVAILALL